MQSGPGPGGSVRGGGLTALPVVAVRTPERDERLNPVALWFPAVAMAASLLFAATTGLTFGVLAALRVSAARDRWPAVVQAHGDVQLWGWFAVFISTLLFEFIIRLNGRPPVPLRSRALVLGLFGGGALLSAVGRFIEVGDHLIVTAGSASMAAGALLLAVIVMRIPPAHPFRVDLHPFFFRTGASWLLLAALAAVAASRHIVSGAAPFTESHLVAEIFLRGFVLNVTFAVGLRAFVGHLGLPPVPVERQRILWILLNGGIVVGVSGSAGFGLPGVPSLAAVGNLLVAAGMLWATWAFDMKRLINRTGRRLHRAQALAPIAWLGLVVYAVTLSAQAGMTLRDGTSPPLYEDGAARHMLALGFVAPLLIAMAHVVLERFLIGRLSGERWLTLAFVLLVLSWPMRVVPPLIDGDIGGATRGVMGTAGILAAVALLVAAAVAVQNALAADRYVNLLRRLGGMQPEHGIPMAGGTRATGSSQGRARMHEIDVRADIAAGREPFPRIMAAVQALAPGEGLRLIAPFEPEPLYAVLAERGLQHETSAQGDGSWHVTIRRGSVGV